MGNTNPGRVNKFKPQIRRDSINIQQAICKSLSHKITNRGLATKFYSIKKKGY